uniref:Uncharacterized protein n=1 Tax=Streptomyces sp. 14R-10 TaxID=1442159 RepID=W0FTQ2_9ACTN|nr:hypothetical protein [Streptomyces sp. 14R-10]AHF46210.1 hypothetical protein pZL1.45c [Streptomyces sp. 14R-10]
MIPNGITPADDQMAADIFGVSVGYWRDTKAWEAIRGLRLLNRDGARRRVFSKEQLLAAQVQKERAKATNQVPKYDLPPVPAGEHPDDLLDLEEALHAIPKEQRVTLDTWKAYRYGTKTRLPDPDYTLGGKKIDGAVTGGEDFWRRQTILDWNATRRGRGNPKGRPAGSKNKRPRPADPKAEERKQRVRQLLDEHPSTLTAKKLAEELGVHAVHAERLLRAARLGKVSSLLDSKPDLTVEDVQRELGMHVVSHARKLLDEARKANAGAQ